MRKLFFFCLLLSYLTKGQNCSPTLPPSATFYQNSTYNHTANINAMYLCGPNTIVYDTTSSGTCNSYLNSGTALNLKNTCTFANFVYMKSNSVLNVLPGTGGLIFVYYESGAIINNPYNLNVDSDYCASITFPVANCIATSLNEKKLEDGSVLFPSPARDVLNIHYATDVSDNSMTVLIYNSLGNLILEEEVRIKNNNTSINTANLQSGVYYLTLSGIKKRLIIVK